MRFSLVALLMVLGFALGGCATTGDALREKESGTMKVYPVTNDQAWDIARQVFRWEGADAIEEHRADGYMVTSSGMNFVSEGTVMAAWVEPAINDGSAVTVVTKRRIATNIFTTLTEGTFHKRFAQAVEIVKAGKKLPVTPPADK